MSDEDGSFVFSPQPKVFVRELFTAYAYEFPIHVVEHGEPFQELVNVLRSATESDVIILSLNGPGGSLFSAQALVAEITCSEALVVARCAGELASALTMLALACDKLEIDENCSCLIHSMSYGLPYSKAVDVEKNAAHSKLLHRRVFNRTYEGFLTEEEIESVINGHEMLFFGDEFSQRWQQREDYFKAIEQGDILESQMKNESVEQDDNGFSEPFPFLDSPEEHECNCLTHACEK